jgi:hypothetical protein
MTNLLLKGFVDDLLAMFCAFKALGVASFTQEDLERHVHVFFRDMDYDDRHVMLNFSGGSIPAVCMSLMEVESRRLMRRATTFPDLYMEYFPAEIGEDELIVLLGRRSGPEKHKLMLATTSVIKEMRRAKAIKMVEDEKKIAVAAA